MKLSRIQGHPEKIARGFAIGVFVGLLPLMGAQIPVVLFLAFTARLNKVAAVSGMVLAANPFTAIPFYIVYLQLGALVLKQPPPIGVIQGLGSLRDFGNLGADLLAAFLVGAIIIAIVGGVLSYLVVRSLLYWYRK